MSNSAEGKGTRRDMWRMACTGSEPSLAAQRLQFGVSLGLTLLAVYLAILRMPSLESPAARCWMLALAVVMPELFVILHGLAASGGGEAFFSLSPKAPLSLSLPFRLGTAADPMSSSSVETGQVLR